MIQRRSFRAMGTDVELFLAAEPGPAAEAALESAEREFERVEALLSRFRPESELSALNRAGRLEAGDDLLAVVELALDARTSDRRTVRPDGPRRARRSRLRPDVRGGRARRSIGSTPSAAAAAPSASRADDRARAWRRTSTSVGSARATPSTARRRSSPTAGPALVDAGGDIAAVGRPDALGWRVGIETADDYADARARGRRDRDLRPRPAPLAPRTARSATI